MLPRQLLAAPRSMCLRYSSTSTPENIVLPRLQSDLKTAMRAKNKPALNTIRALQAEIQKQIKSSSASIEEFRNAKREDLVEKEQAQLDVLNGYAKEIPTVEESEIDALVNSAVEGLEQGKRNVGAVMGKVMAGVKGRPFDLEYITKKIQEAVGAK